MLDFGMKLLFQEDGLVVHIEKLMKNVVFISHFLFIHQPLRNYILLNWGISELDIRTWKIWSFDHRRVSLTFNF